MIHSAIEMTRNVAGSARTHLTPDSSALQIAQRLTVICVLFTATGVMPVAAQIGETSDSLCGTGLEVIYVLVATIIVIAGFIYGSFEGGAGFIAYDNPDPQKSQAGKDRIRSGIVSILGPPTFFLLIAAGLEFTDYAIAECFVPDLGLFGTITLSVI